VRIERLAGRRRAHEQQRLGLFELRDLGERQQQRLEQLRRHERVDELGGIERLVELGRFERKLRLLGRLGRIERRLQRVEQRRGRLSVRREAHGRGKRQPVREVAWDDGGKRRYGHRSCVAAREVHGERQ
jgi:hypothetical protein